MSLCPPAAAAVADRASASDAWRLKCKAERCANTTYFAWNEFGHSAKDCPSIQLDTNGTGDAASKSKNLIGICYRCFRDPACLGLDTDTHSSRAAVLRQVRSRKYNLSRCRWPSQRDGSFPFASCFACSGLGYPASARPKNNGKGVWYPNGGSCKLCGEMTHLAKHCSLWEKLASLISPPLAVFFSRNK